MSFSFPFLIHHNSVFCMPTFMSHFKNCFFSRAVMMDNISLPSVTKYYILAQVNNNILKWYLKHALLLLQIIVAIYWWKLFNQNLSVEVSVSGNRSLDWGKTNKEHGAQFFKTIRFAFQKFLCSFFFLQKYRPLYNELITDKTIHFYRNKFYTIHASSERWRPWSRKSR